MNALTKAAVDKVAQVTGQKPTVIRNLLENGWTFTWDLTGEYRWEKASEQNVNSIGPFLA